MPYCCVPIVGSFTRKEVRDGQYQITFGQSHIVIVLACWLTLKLRKTSCDSFVQ